MLHFQTTGQGLVFKVHIQPRSAANRIAGVREDAVKIRLTAPPVDGEANRSCIKFLAKKLNVAKSDLEIISGASSRSKKIQVRLADDKTRAKRADQIQKKICALAGKKDA